MVGLAALYAGLGQFTTALVVLVGSLLIFLLWLAHFRRGKKT